MSGWAQHSILQGGRLPLPHQARADLFQSQSPDATCFLPANVCVCRDAALCHLLLQAAEGEGVVGTAQRPFVPMEVVGRADGDGLGMVHW